MFDTVSSNYHLKIGLFLILIGSQVQRFSIKSHFQRISVQSNRVKTNKKLCEKANNGNYFPLFVPSSNLLPSEEHYDIFFTSEFV